MLDKIILLFGSFSWVNDCNLIYKRKNRVNPSIKAKLEGQNWYIIVKNPKDELVKIKMPKIAKFLFLKILFKRIKVTKEEIENV